MRILVLGASGFIGGAIARRLVDDGHEVRGLARGALDVDGVEARPGSLGDPRSMAEAARGCDAVVHAAGIVSCRAAPRALRWTHVAGTENLLKAARHEDVGRIVLVSCADVTLGNLDRIQWDEGKVPGGLPHGERARTLALSEEVALSASGVDVVALRPAWVWGPGDTSRLPGLLREALDGGIRLVGDGSTYIATTYVDHLVDAVVAALGAEDVAGRAFHVADPVFQHARDFFDVLSARLELPAPRRGPPFAVAWPLSRLGRGALTSDEILQRGKSTLLEFNAAIGKLGYEPEVTLEAGLDRLAEWVEAEGGASAVARMERPPPKDAEVDAQVAAAGGD